MENSIKEKFDIAIKEVDKKIYALSCKQSDIEDNLYAEADEKEIPLLQNELMQLKEEQNYLYTEWLLLKKYYTNFFKKDIVYTDNEIKPMFITMIAELDEQISNYTLKISELSDVLNWLDESEYKKNRDEIYKLKRARVRLAEYCLILENYFFQFYN